MLNWLKKFFRGRSFDTTQMNRLDRLREILRQKLAQGELPLPRVIALETRSRCNGQCEYCIASIHTDPRPDVLMDDGLIDKILNELAQLRYSNRLSFYHTNEPLLDERIFAIVGQARRLLPYAYLELKTNGRKLTLEKLMMLFEQGLDMLYVNDYQTEADVLAGRHGESVQKVLDGLQGVRRFRGHFDGKRFYDRVIVQLRSREIVMGARAGSSPNHPGIKETLHKPCLRPFEHMIIGSEGQVGLCGEDALIQVQMGRVGEDSIYSIWHNEEYQRVRLALLDGNRHCKPTCAQCDSKGVTGEIFAEYGLTSQERG
ncbi:MAG: SPASM domain-containing protein [Magnetococcus sp. DMHC-6]